MNRETGSAFLWMAVALLVLSLVVGSPAGTFAGLILSSVSAAMACVSSTRGRRLLSLLLLVVSVALAIRMYPAFARDQKAYAERAAGKSAD